MWNLKTGRVRAIVSIVFHAEYDPDASLKLVKRVTPLPDSASHVGLVTVMEPNRPMDLEGLAPLESVTWMTTSNLSP